MLAILRLWAVSHLDARSVPLSSCFLFSRYGLLLFGAPPPGVNASWSTTAILAPSRFAYQSLSTLSCSQLSLLPSLSIEQAEICARNVTCRACTYLSVTWRHGVYFLPWGWEFVVALRYPQRFIFLLLASVTHHKDRALTWKRAAESSDINNAYDGIVIRT